MQDDKKDAERWRALLSSARISYVGSSGIDMKGGDLILRPGEVWHFGVHFWSEVNADRADPNDPIGRKLLVDYADAMHAKRYPPPCKASPPPDAKDCSYHWLHSERSIEPSIAQWMKGAGSGLGQVGAWYCVGEQGPVSPAELERRGWQYLGPVDTSKYAENDGGPKPRCGCRRCDKERKAAAGIPPVATKFPPPVVRFIVCETCGNKRCPRATDHRNACTGSNEPGQPGSDYE